MGSPLLGDGFKSLKMQDVLGENSINENEILELKDVYIQCKSKVIRLFWNALCYVYGRLYPIWGKTCQWQYSNCALNATIVLTISIFAQNL